MCGIFFSFTTDPVYVPCFDESCPNQVEFSEEKISTFLNRQPPPLESESASWAELAVREVLRRGPNYAHFSRLSPPSGSGSFTLVSSVLSLRQPFLPQPQVSENLYFQFNGELYNPECSGNDCAFAFQAVLQGLKDDLPAAVASLEGEFAFVLTDRKRVYFAKDKVGKRSLLFRHDKKELIVASVLPGVDAQECKGGTLYTFDTETGSLSSEQYTEGFSVETPRSGLPELEDALRKACLRRQTTIQPVHPLNGADLAILFSGGLDCSVLAALIAGNAGEKATIDLLTVGFENPRTQMQPADSPDRILSKRSWFELCQAFPKVLFRLVQVDVPYEEFLRRKNHVMQLMHPCATEMDLSIAMAFHCASQPATYEAVETVGDISGLDWLGLTQNENLYTRRYQYFSGTPVLISGLGADELFGGYSRHENIFHEIEQDSSAELIEEKYSELSASLSHDIDVIYERNLGRDDRVMSCWGKELRYPYLDEHVIRVSMQVVPQEKLLYEWQEVTTKKGKKIRKEYIRKAILRELGKKLNIPMAAGEIKRAIQFGAKLAKIHADQSKTKGTDKIT